MYGKLGNVAEAGRIFERMGQRNLVSWNSMILGYAHSGDGKRALELFTDMQEQGVLPDARTFLGALKGCTNLALEEEGVHVDGRMVKVKCLNEGRSLHSQLRKYGLESDLFLASSLMDMYSKCGSVGDARQVFDSVRNPNVVCWNAIISGCAQNGEGEQAWTLFSRMQLDGLLPDSWTFVAVLKACNSGTRISEWKTLEESVSKRGILIHWEIQQLGLESNTFVGNSLIDMYAKLGRMTEARALFDRMEKNRNLVSWNTLLAGYVQTGECEAALEQFSRMQEAGLVPDCLTYMAALNALAHLAWIEKDRSKKLMWLSKGQSLHSEIRQRGYESNTFVANTLIDMYAKCAAVQLAVKVFEEMKERSLVSWNVMIMAYAQAGEWDKALELLEVMKGEGFSPDSRTYLAAIYACSGLTENEPGDGKRIKLSCLEMGLRLHAELELKEGLSDVFLASALVDLYSKCGSLADAQRVFDKANHKDVVLWTSLISGYSQCGEGEQALRLFTQMQQQEQEPNAFTYAAVLSACISLVDDGEDKSKYLETTVALHSQLAKAGYETDKLVASTLLNLYAKCGDMHGAQRVFDRMEEQDVVSWTSLMLGYVEHEQSEEALELFWGLQRKKGLKPDALAFSAALKACCSSACLETGKLIHEQAKEAGLSDELIVVNSLIGFYGRCGSMVEARQVFDSAARSRDGVTWSALIAGYSHKGDVVLVLKMFERMRVAEDLHPDGVTFLSVLTACTHAGLVDAAKDYFRLMVCDYGITPRLEHYTCMVDLLGRENRVDEAVEVMRRMHLEADSQIWIALLDACKKWGNVDVAKVAFEAVQNQPRSSKLCSGSSAAYVLMANTYKHLG